MGAVVVGDTSTGLVHTTTAGWVLHSRANEYEQQNTNKGKVNMYGASAKKGNKHFDDQVELYIKQQTKRMTLKKEEVYKMAERVYWPGQ